MRASLIFIITIVGLAIVAGAGYFGYRTIQDETAATPPPPNTVPVERGDVKLTVTAPGQLAGVRTETVRAPGSTTILEVLVRPGDVVKKNDVIARVDDAPLKTALEKAQGAAADARDQLAEQAESAEELVRKAQDNLNSLQLNYPSQERADLDLSRAEDALDDAESAQSKAKKSLDAAKKTRDNARTALNAANTAVNSAQSVYNAAAAALAASQAA